MFQVLLTGKRVKTTCIENESKEKTCKVCGEEIGWQGSGKIRKDAIKSKSTCNGEKIGLKMFWLTLCPIRSENGNFPLLYLMKMSSLNGVGCSKKSRNALA